MLQKGVLERMDNQDQNAESVRRRMLVFDLARLPLWRCVLFEYVDGTT